jgi:hypothetical protein
MHSGFVIISSKISKRQNCETTLWISLATDYIVMLESEVLQDFIVMVTSNGIVHISFTPTL